MADKYNLANAYLTVIPSMEGSRAEITKSLVKEVAPAADKAGQEGGKNLGAGLLSQTKKVLAPAAVSAALVGVGTGLYQLGAKFTEATNTIRVGTGASGDALAGLVDDAKQVASKVPASFDQISSVVADVNTRLGLSGEVMQTVASQYVEAGRILGEEIDINRTTAAFSAFKIEGVDVSAAMDDLFRVSQATGVGMNELADGVKMAGPAAQSLGLDFKDTASLIGSFDKAGLQSNKMMAGLSKGLVTLAKDGEEPREALTRITDSIQGLIDEGDTAGATDLAAQIFGTRNAQAFVNAIDGGALALDDLMSGIGATSDTILGVGEETRTAADSFAIMKNNAELMAEPLASLAFSTVSDALEGMVPYAQAFSRWMQDNPAMVKVMAGVLGALAAGLAVAAAAQWAMNSAMLASPITWIIVGVMAVIAAIVLLAVHWEDITAWISETWSKFVDWLGNSFDTLGRWFSDLWTGMKASAMDLWARITDGIKGAWEGIKTLTANAAAWVKDKTLGKFNELRTGAVEAFTKMRDAIGRAWGGLKAIAAKPVNFVIETVYGKGIKAFTESVAGKLGFNVSLPYVAPLKFAKGGVLPGYSPGRDSILAMLSGGEGILVPEAVRGLGAGFVGWANRYFSHGRSNGGVGTSVTSGGCGGGSCGLPGFADGGIVGFFKDAARGIGGFLADPIGSVLDLIVRPVERMLGGVDATVWGDVAKGGAKSILAGIPSFFKKKADTIGNTDLVGAARRALGVPYVWGGSTLPPGLDCSGLVHWASAQLGLGWPRLTAAGYQSASRVKSMNQAVPGDLLFWGNPAYHVGIYTGPGMMVHAPQPGDVVRDAAIYGSPTVGAYAGGGGRGRMDTYSGLVQSTARRSDSADQMVARLRRLQYDNGGWLEPGETMAVNKTGQPEAVFTKNQLSKLGAWGEGPVTLVLKTTSGDVKLAVAAEIEEVLGAGGSARAEFGVI
ncbi:MAG: NlpC/P60 family protein [Actinomycetaceae bacterium]|nr:NlpC/P60 family protein [Actinomycetaceae bacterium]